MTDPHCRPLPGTTGNPYLEAWRRQRNSPHTLRSEDLVARFGFAIPDETALEVIAQHSPHGVVEIGAGTGYWAKLLADRGVDVAAFDIAPPPSPANTSFAGEEPWFPVAAGDERVVAEFPERTLLLVWPTRNEDWAADAALLHAAGGGPKLIFVGEPPGGQTGDLRLHAALGLVDRCLACTYGVMDVPCTCAVTAQWTLVEELPLPNWKDTQDQLYVFDPVAQRLAKRRLSLIGIGRNRRRRSSHTR